MSGDPEQEYFADGIVEEIIAALSRLRGFFVIARNSAFTYKGKAVHVQQVGRDLGVRYVLEGSVRRAGDRVRIGVQLADAGTGREVWSERYERALVNVFALQDEIAASVVVAVEPKLYAAERDRIQQKQPDHLDAWDCVIRALPHVGQGADHAVPCIKVVRLLLLGCDHARQCRVLAPPATTTLAAISSCRAKTLTSARSEAPDQTSRPVPASASWNPMRTRSPALRTLPSRRTAGRGRARPVEPALAFPL